MILLSFDTEEFDVPREHGVDFPLDEAMKVSVYGTNRILDCLKNNGVKATFFCTSNFAENAPEVMRRIISLMRQLGKLVEVVRHANEILGDGYRLSVVSADHLAVQGGLTDVLRQLAVGFSRPQSQCLVAWL